MYLNEILVRLIEHGVVALPADVERALASAHRKERGKIAKSQLALILKNIDLAKKSRIPICQDTGVPVFYVKIGRRCDHVFETERELATAVRIATEKSILRPNIVDPLTKRNSNNNTGKGIPVIHYELFDGDHIEITYSPKGAGTENMSELWMLRPGADEREIEKLVLEKVKDMGGRPCPPYILGIGIGGTSERCLELAKKASMRNLEEKNGDRKLAGLEKALLKKINRTGIGPMGLGGDTTCLAVNIEVADCHTATMPLAIAVSCWADRRAKVILRKHGHAWVD
jgi:fumarate hydratase subunit alpha